MWSLYRQASEWGERPSNILGIDPTCSYLCWCLDDTVLFFGYWVQNKLAERTAKGKPKYTLAQVLDKDFGKPKKQSLAGLMVTFGGFAGPAHG